MSFWKLIFFFVLILFYSCSFSDRSIDLEKAKLPVVLNSGHLEAFSNFRDELLKDSSAILRKSQTYMGVRTTGWMSTNFYYLKQIDSTKYAMLYSQLKGKFEDHVLIHPGGEAVFRLKTYVEMHSDNYNQSYIHELVSRNTESVEAIYGDVDTVYTDSVVDKNWRYVFFKALTGH